MRSSLLDRTKTNYQEAARAHKKLLSAGVRGKRLREAANKVKKARLKWQCARTKTCYGCSAKIDEDDMLMSYEDTPMCNSCLSEIVEYEYCETLCHVCNP